MFRNQLSSSTVRRNISYLKSFLGHAFKKGLLKSKDYEEFTVKVPRKEIISLTETEFEQIKKVKLPDHLNKVRQTFIFSCLTGIRFSDIINVKREAVEITKTGAVLKITAQKTKSLTVIPLLSEAIDILKQRNYLLNTVSIQRYSLLLKKIARLAGVDQQIRVIEFKGAQRIEKLIPKWSTMSSHSARRAFINISLSKNIPIQLVASVTHGGNINSLMRYLKIDEIQKIEVFNKAWAKKK